MGDETCKASNLGDVQGMTLHFLKTVFAELDQLQLLTREDSKNQISFKFLQVSDHSIPIPQTTKLMCI